MFFMFLKKIFKFFFIFFMFFVLLMFFVLFNVVFLFLLKHKCTKLQI